MPEHAISNSGVLNDVNDLSRYKCNDTINSGNFYDARNTYEVLYNAYSSSSNKTTPVTDNLVPTSNCINGCPHALNSANAPQLNSVLAYDTATKKLLVSDLAIYLDDCGARIRDYDKNNTPKSYTNTRSYATNLHDVSYNALVNTRNNLDTQMNEILANNKNTILSEKQSELDASVYSTLLWTVMITSLIYYVFTKI